ncbi:HAD hydrolase-like protein [Streptomyces sp. NPDC014006]|uniref:HAD hydrolase-like protein n=1 Tax=Streptomyces sp. NPDC014006 TaxID=3364870 RepID=UPI003700B3E6
MCRKPEPGMLIAASRAWGCRLKEGWMIGDAITDVQAGAAAGCRTMLVRTGRGAVGEDLVEEICALDPRFRIAVTVVAPHRGPGLGDPAFRLTGPSGPAADQPPGPPTAGPRWSPPSRDGGTPPGSRCAAPGGNWRPTTSTWTWATPPPTGPPATSPGP